MERFTTERRKPGILYQGFKHRVYRESKARRTWCCTKKDCKAVCSTDLNDLMIIDGRYEHNHGEPDDRTVQRLKVRQESKRKATDEAGERPNKIIMGEIARFDRTGTRRCEICTTGHIQKEKENTTKTTTVKRGNTRGATIVRHVF